MVQSNKNLNLLYLIFYFPHDFPNTQRSEKEGAALQMIMTNGISKTGFSNDDFARLLNNEAA